jgi:hypothetical protein
MITEDLKDAACGNQDHVDYWDDEGGCAQCQWESKEAKRKAAFDAFVTRYAPTAREFLDTEGLTNTEAVREAWAEKKAAARRLNPEYDRALAANQRAMGLAPDQAFISATPAHLKFGHYARLLSHDAITKASGGALSLDHAFPRNRLKADPPALGLHIPANLRCLTEAENKSRKNRISPMLHHGWLQAGLGALAGQFATLPGDERLVYQGPRPPYLPNGERLPYPEIDRCSLINVELPEGDDEEAFFKWLLHSIRHGQRFMDVPCAKMEADLPEPDKRAPSGSCVIIWAALPQVDAMGMLNFASLIQPEGGTVIYAHAGPDEDAKRLFPLTFDGDGLTMSAYAAKALAEIAALYARYGLEAEQAMGGGLRPAAFQERISISVSYGSIPADLALRTFGVPIGSSYQQHNKYCY